MRKKQRAAAEPGEEPISPGQDTHETVLQLVQGFTTDDWQGKKVYLYRVWPVIDKKSDDHFIAKLSEAFDEDYLLKNWGSGRYHLQLNDAQGHTLATQNVSIHNPAHPPKVDPAEVVESDARNKTYFEIWGPRAAKAEPAASAEGAAVGELARLVGKALDQKTGASAPANGLTEATTQLVLGMSKGRDELAAKLAELAPGTDSLKSLDRAVELLKKLQPEVNPTAAPIEALDRAVDLLRKLQPTPRALEKNPVEQVTAMLDLVYKFKEIMPSAATESGGSDLGSIAVIVREVADLLKNPLTIAMNMWATSKTHTSAAPSITTPPTPQSPPPQSNMARQEPFGPSAPHQAQAGPAAAPPPPQTGPGPAPPPQNRVIALANAITPVMLRWLHDDERGEEIGTSFAAWVAEGWGTVELETLQAAGADMIVELYRQSPVWVIIAPMETKFREFVKAFVRWQPDEPQGDETDSDDDNEPMAEPSVRFGV
jgi:hypothetical protein